MALDDIGCNTTGRQAYRRPNARLCQTLTIGPLLWYWLSADIRAQVHALQAIERFYQVCGALSTETGSKKAYTRTDRGH